MKFHVLHDFITSTPFNPILPGLLNTLQTRGSVFYPPPPPLLIRLFFYPRSIKSEDFLYRSFKSLKNVIFHVKLLTPTLIHQLRWSFCYDVVRSLFIYPLYAPCYCCPQSFLAFLLNAGSQQIRSQMNRPLHEARVHTLFRLQTKLLRILTGTPRFLVAGSMVITIIRTD